MRAATYVEVTGRLVRPPTEKDVNGTAVKEFSLAVDHPSGAQFFDVVLWGQEAEQFRAAPGTWIHVEGSLRQERWRDKDTGDPRGRVRINADFAQEIDLSITRARSQKVADRVTALGVGSRVEATVGLPESSISKGDQGEVSHVSKQTVTIKFDSGARATLSKEDAATLSLLSLDRTVNRSNDVGR